MAARNDHLPGVSLGLGQFQHEPALYSSPMKDRHRVVFISRRNSLRSVLAEACLTQLAPTKFVVASCGQPGSVAPDFHPAAVGALRSASIPLPAAAPKGWDGLLRRRTFIADFVITLDQDVSHEAPAWPGQPELATWPFPDVAAGGGDEEMAVAAIRILYSLRRRLELFTSLPLHGSDRNDIRSDVRDLAHLQ